MDIAVDGATLYVEVDGPESNPALLLWPPGRCTLRVWDHLVARLTPRFQTVRIDIRGLGRSSPSRQPGYAVHVRAIRPRRLRRARSLGRERCHVWSQSWGSRPATVFCAYHPERVISAALYAANVDLPDVQAQREGTKRAAELRREVGIESQPVPVGINDHLHPDEVGKAMAALRKFRLASVVDRLTIPVLIGTGSHDPNLASSRVIAEIAPDAKLAVLEAVGHNGILEHPELALRTFLDFHDSLTVDHSRPDEPGH